MGFKVIREILLQLLEENIPKDSHPILCLAKTDQERAKAKRRREGIQRNTGDKAARDVSSREYLSEFEREKRLRCQATRGTVALFNAVKQHQTNIGKQLQGSKSGFEEERILTQVTTSDFLDRLSAGISAPKLSKTH
uniref:RRP15-like protein n=1 Tax=Schistosoma haematobium TaxID=6185 RepID=A0A094ZZY3_SCHHA